MITKHVTSVSESKRHLLAITSFVGHPGTRPLVPTHHFVCKMQRSFWELAIRRTLILLKHYKAVPSKRLQRNPKSISLVILVSKPMKNYSSFNSACQLFYQFHSKANLVGPCRPSNNVFVVAECSTCHRQNPKYRNTLSNMRPTCKMLFGLINTKVWLAFKIPRRGPIVQKISS